MKTTVHRTHIRQTVIKAFNKNRYQSSDVCVPDHMSQNAVILMEDHVHLTVGLETQERLLLLFTDCLVIAKAKSLCMKLKARVSLCHIWLASCVHQVTSRTFNAKNSFVIGWPTTNYVVTLSSPETKEKWFRALDWHSRKARQTLIPSRILLSVHLFNDTAMTQVMVDIHSTADSVVQSVIEHNSLPGTVSKYQLCVGHDREEEMYPLIGHELPFCILMHTLGSVHCHTHTFKQPSDGMNAHHLQKHPNSPQFTLRIRATVQTDTYTGSSLKHKRKKSLIEWALRKGFSNQSEEKNEPPPTSSKLFGQPLTSVCLDGNLPRPVMDLLYVLYHEGPKTLGVFRRSANVKNCRVLKERLNSGHYVPLLGESVLTAASLLTEFLRKLPGSVLGCELYEDWMEVLETDDLQDRYFLAKSVLEKLPLENRSLLCYLFGMFHCIHKHADINQMRAANLALCVAPNMLWRLSPCSTEQESHNNLKVAALVQFLIESSPTIFGDEVESIFAALLNAAQETDDLTADASFLLHSSSEKTYQDGVTSPLYSSNLDCFLPLSTLHREVHPLKITMAAAKGAYSCGALNLKSSQSSASVSSLAFEELSQSTNRCLSEPSMCPATSGTPVLPHIPVLRQSSYDNTAVGGKSVQLQDAMGFSPFLQAHKGTGKGCYAFWKSPEFSKRFQHPAQRLASMSSLSFTTTTTSSVRSLDSALSFSSAESIPSPTANQPCPFLFGASARLRPLTPEIPRRQWKMAFTYEEQEAEPQERDNDCSRMSNGPKNTTCGCDLTLRDERMNENKEGITSLVRGNQISAAKEKDRYGTRVKKEMESEDILIGAEKVMDREKKNNYDIKNCCLESPTCGLKGESLVSESVSGVVCHSNSIETCPSRYIPECLCNTHNPAIDEGISQENQHQQIPDNENWDLGHILPHSQPCPVHTLMPEDAHTQHTSTQSHLCSHRQRKTSAAYIRLEQPLSNSDAHTDQTSASTLPSVQGRMNRMKITLFPTMGQVMLKQSHIKSLREQRVTHGFSSDGIEPEVAQVNIPQSLFYRQNVPLVLHSVLIRKPPSVDCGDYSPEDKTEDCMCSDNCLSKSLEDDDDEFKSTASAGDNVCAQDFSTSEFNGDNKGPDVGHIVSINTKAELGHTVSINRVDSIRNSISNSENMSPGYSKQPVPSSKVQSKNPGTFRHTICIRLSTNIRNTVKAYFGHSLTLPHSKTNSAASAPSHNKTLNRQLFSSKLLWQKTDGNIHVSAHTEGIASQSLSDESSA